MERVKEKSTAYLTVTFRDKAGSAQAPTSATYRIDDVATGTEVLNDTAIGTVAATVELTLPPSVNALLGTDNPHELRRVTVVALYGADDAVRDEYVYEVVNLAGVTE